MFHLFYKSLLQTMNQITEDYYAQMDWTPIAMRTVSLGDRVPSGVHKTIHGSIMDPLLSPYSFQTVCKVFSGLVN